MATPNLNDLSIKLSRAVQDPVLVATDKGLIFNSDQRLDYIRRGLSAMLRAIEAVHVDPSYVFPDFISSTIILFTAGGGGEQIIAEQMILTDYYEIYELFYRGHDMPKSIRADRIPAKDYYSTELGINEFYPKPLLSGDDTNPLNFKNKAYWTILNGSIQLVPTILEHKYLEIILYHKKRFKEFVYGGDQDLVIAGDYEDLLLNYASREAHIDSGLINKYQTLTTAIGEKLQVIAGKKIESTQKGERQGGAV